VAWDFPTLSGQQGRSSWYIDILAPIV
jgi:hypothetical protein